jgi:hypothetical protein
MSETPGNDADLVSDISRVLEHRLVVAERLGANFPERSRNFAGKPARTKALPSASAGEPAPTGAVHAAIRG